MLTFLALAVGDNGRPELRPAQRQIGTNHSANNTEWTFFLDEREKIWGYENRESDYRPIFRKVGEFLDHDETDGVTILGVFAQEDLDHVEKLAQYWGERRELLELRRHQRMEIPSGCILPGGDPS